MCHRQQELRCWLFIFGSFPFVRGGKQQNCAFTVNVYQFCLFPAPRKSHNALCPHHFFFLYVISSLCKADLKLLHNEVNIFALRWAFPLRLRPFLQSYPQGMVENANQWHSAQKRVHQSICSVARSCLTTYQTLSRHHYRMFAAIRTSGPHVREIQKEPRGHLRVDLAERKRTK